MVSSLFKSIAALVAASFAASAFAQSYPNKPVRLINPWTPAGPAELLARTVGAKLQESLGQPFLVESRPGANGTIGATFVAKSAPDGYTILFSHVGPMAIHPAVASSMPYDTVKDFEPITQVAAGALVLLVRNDIPAKNVAELVAHAKANAGKLSCGSVGPASTTHFACEMLNMMGGISTIHVPYKGSAPVVTDMLGGQIAMSFLNIAGVKGQLDAKQLRPLAVTTLAEMRSESLRMAASMVMEARSPVLRSLISTSSALMPFGPTMSWNGRPMRSIDANFAPARSSVSSSSTDTPARSSLA